MKRLFFVGLLLMAGPALADKCADLGTPDRFTPEAAMKAIFCEYNVEQSGTLIPLRLTSGWQTKSAETLATPLLVAQYREADQEKGVLVVARQMLEKGEPYVSHGQGAEISVYVFKHTGAKWIYEKGKKSVTTAGSWGNAPGAHLAKLGREKYGVEFGNSFCNQGYCEGGVFLVSLSEPTFDIIGEFPLDADNGGAVENEEDGWEFSGTVEAVDTSGDYYTLRAVYKGTMAGEGDEPVVPHPSPICYRKGAESYAVVELPDCAKGTALPETVFHPQPASP